MPTAMPSTPETIGFCDAGQREQEIRRPPAALAADRDGHEVGEVVAGRKRAGHAEEDMDADRRIGVAVGKRRRHRLRTWRG